MTVDEVEDVNAAVTVPPGADHRVGLTEAVSSRRGTFNLDLRLRDNQHQVHETTEFSTRVLDERSAPGLAVRPLPEPGVAAKAMAGHELWHPVTDAVVVAGLRQTAAASRLLQLLPGGALNRVLLRMATPETRSTRTEATLGTVCAVSTLICWPARQREEMVARVAEAAEAAMPRVPQDSRGGTARALHWVQRLARVYPDDPMVLAPLLFQLRLIRAGQPYVVPPGSASAHLRGVVVRVVAAGTPAVGSGLGAADVDRDGFIAALTAGQARAAVEPSAVALARAADLANQLTAQLPEAPPTSPLPVSVTGPPH